MGSRALQCDKTMIVNAVFETRTTLLFLVDEEQ